MNRLCIGELELLAQYMSAAVEKIAGRAGALRPSDCSKGGNGPLRAGTDEGRKSRRVGAAISNELRRSLGIVL